MFLTTLKEFLETGRERRDCVMEPWLPTRGLCMVFAPTGVGKTMFCMNVALSVATGQPWLHWWIPRKRPVVYLDGEMPAFEMWSRYKMFMKMRGIQEPPEGFRLMVPEDQPNGIMPDLATTRGRRQVLEGLGEPFLEQGGLLIIDNISTLYGNVADENDAAAWSGMQEFLLTLRRLGASVLLVHHAGKDKRRVVQRGTSRREDVLDTVLQLYQPGKEDPKNGNMVWFHAKFTKHRAMTGQDVCPFTAWVMEDQYGNLVWQKDVKGEDYDPATRRKKVEKKATK